MMTTSSSLLLRRTILPRWNRQPAILNNGTFAIVRNHVNHGHAGGDPSVHSPPPSSGPRVRNVDLGFPAAKHTGNILRLLESSHGSFFYNTVDTLSTVWHSNSQSWKQQSTNYDNNNEWMSVNPIHALTDQSSNPKVTSWSSSIPPRLCSMNFSDDRTALIKLLGQDGYFRYLQLLRLDGDVGVVAHNGMTMLPNDGWVILQEVIIQQGKRSNNVTDDVSSWISIHNTILTYLDIEHGGGDKSYKSAKTLFHPNSKLMSVGIDEIDAAATRWSGPVGSYVEIPLTHYLEGIEQQSPHDTSAKVHDAIVSIDYTSGANAAAATVRVGNGAKTLVFEDNLLLGRSDSTDNDNLGWFILAKTFSSQKWKA